jgi:1-aminocyclopropane-1-carboxylate deaminase
MSIDLEKHFAPTPEQKIILKNGRTIHVKRDDLLHAEISGNKWRKLKYNLVKAKEYGCDTLITFGGAFSNHLAATAKAAQLANLKSIGIIRGTYVDTANPTMKFASSCGMELIPVSVDEYNERNNYNYHDQLKLEFPLGYVIPEGGANFEGVSGAMEIMKELKNTYDLICCAVGTGTTAAGLILAKPPRSKILCFNNFKSAEGVAEMIGQKINLVLNESDTVAEYKNDFEVVTGYDFGGYARIDDELKRFTKECYADYQLPLDLVYTAKAFYGLNKMIEKREISNEAKILFYHSGGLQGNAGFGFSL